MGFKIHIPGYIVGIGIGLIVGNYQLNPPVEALFFTLALSMSLIYLVPSIFDHKPKHKEDETQ